MDWAKPYYTRQSETFARAVITESHHAIAARIAGWIDECRAIERCDRVLELGAGNGGTAAALADLGYEVHAVEFNPSDAALARQLAESVGGGGSLTVIEEDFYQAELEDRFGFVYYWDGFGIGTDADQRRLLERVAAEWLTPTGRVLIDVFSPWNWARQDGDTSVYTARDGEEWQRTVRFDAEASRLVDHWQRMPDGGEPRSQTIRCYTLPEFVSLVDGTGLVVDAFVGMDGRPFEATAFEDDPETRVYLEQTNGYFALLRLA